MTVDAFFSYRTREAERARLLLDALAAVGVSVWRDLTNIRAGDSISDEVRAGIASSRVLLVFATSDWPLSRLCVAELICAWTAAERLAAADSHSSCNPAARRVLLLKPHDLGSLDHIRFGPLADCRAFDLPADPAALPEVARQIKAHLDDLDARTFGDADPPAKPNWIPRRGPTSERFVGRERELWELHASLTASRFVAITGRQLRDTAQLRGLGGLGKTLLASHYAHTFAASWPGGIFWLPVDPSWVAGEESEESLRQHSYALLDRLADALGVVPVTGNLRATAVAVREAIAAQTAGKPYLWVLDDVPPGTSQLALDALRPPTDDGALLLTTRYMALGAAGKCLDLSTLDPNAAFYLLTSRSKPTTPEEHTAARALAADVDYHPLALDVLGALLRVATSTAPYTYWRERLAAPSDTAFDRRASALHEQLPTGAARSITRVLESSLQALATELPVDVLRAIAFLGDAPVPAEFLVEVLARTTANPHGGRRRRARGVSRDRIEVALDDLASHSLITRDSSLRTIHIHSLVRWAILRRKLRSGRAHTVHKEHLRAATRRILLRSFSSLASPEVHERFAPLLPHARATALDADESSAELCIRLGDFFGAKGDHQSALAYEEHSFKTRRERLGPEHHDTRSAQQRMADTLHLLGRDAEAMRHLKSLESSLLNDPMPSDANRITLLNVRHHIGVIIGANGDLDASCKLLTEVLDSRRLYLGREHRHTLVTQHALANMLARAGRHQEARSLLEETLPIMIRVNGPTHRDTIITRSTLAQSLARTGEYPRAIELARRSCKDSKDAYGLDHRSTLNAYNNLAVLLAEGSNREEARQLYSMVLTHKRKHLGPTHPDTYSTSYNLSHLLREMGEGDKARVLLEALLPAQLGALGKESDDSVRTRSELAALALSTKDARTASPHLAAVLQFQVRSLGRVHPSTLTTASNLAAAYRLIGLLHEGRNVLKNALSDAGASTTSSSMALCRFHLAVFLGDEDPAAALDQVAMLERWRDEGASKRCSSTDAHVLRNLAALSESLRSRQR